MNFSVFDENAEKSVVKIADGQDYTLLHDSHTGDWLVQSDDEMVQGDWMLTKEDALKYALYRGGIFHEADYSRAPERC